MDIQQTENSHDYTEEMKFEEQENQFQFKSVNTLLSSLRPGIQFYLNNPIIQSSDSSSESAESI